MESTMFKVNGILEKPFRKVMDMSSGSFLKFGLLLLLTLAVLCYVVLLYVWIMKAPDAGFKLVTAPAYGHFLYKNVTKGWDKDSTGRYMIPSYTKFVTDNYDSYMISAKSSFQSPGSAALTMGERDNVGVGSVSSGVGSSCGYDASAANEAAEVYGGRSSFSERELQYHRNTY